MPSTLNPNIPGGLEQIIMKGMALDVRDRYVSATEMLKDMEEFRQNPAILFDYHTVMDDSTRAIPGASQPRTLAERKVQAKTGVRPGSDSARLHTAAPQHRATGTVPQERDSEAIRRAQQRRKAEEKKREEERSRVATTAIVICSAVAVIAVIIFLIALFNGALLNQEKELVEVPYLEGEVYTDGFSERYSDFTIRLQPQQYSESWPAGQIMHQEPAGGSKVQKGSDLWITVSMGEEPPVKIMENYTGVEADQAYAVLSGMGFQVLTRKEASYVYEAGTVTRTDPTSGTELKDGQTVYIYISTGPDLVEEKMPDVLGLEIGRAKELLNQLGFTNVRAEAVESSKPKDQVVYQSVEKNTMVDVTAEIIIHYSQGAEETLPEETPEVETKPEEIVEPKPDPEPVTARLIFSLPERSQDYTLDICLKGTTESIVSKHIAAGETSTILDLTGTGTVWYDLYIDGVFEREQKVEFTHD